jgi:hypothetical protein
VSEPENFLSRWARLKREAAEATEAGEAAATPDAAAPDAAADAPGPAEPIGEAKATSATVPAFDISTLPPIESITAATDIRAFLAPGVPPDLARAALRRAWVADPAIRDFVGIAENQWDFNDPNGIPGFGPLGPLDDVRRLVAQVIGGSRDEEARSDVCGEEKSLLEPANSATNLPEVAAASGEATVPQEAQETSLPSPGVQCSNSSPASDLTQSEDDAQVQTEVSTKRAHGGALPQ